MAKTNYFEREAALTRIQVSLQSAKQQEDSASSNLAAAKAQLDSLPLVLKKMLDDIEADKGLGGIYATQSEIALLLLEETAARSNIVDQKVKALASIEG